MIELRPAHRDAELEDWRRVRMTVLPNERALGVEEMRAQATPERLLLVAYADGELAGSGVTNRSDTGGVFVQPRVLPALRGRGVGTALLHALTDDAHAAGHVECGSHVEEPGALAFAERFGFHEVDRQVEQVRSIGRDEPVPQVPRGIEIVRLAGRPDLASRLFDELVREAVRDFAIDRPIELDEETWNTQWLTDKECSFVALWNGTIVGLAGYEVDHDRPGRGENVLTAVRRDLRGRGIARALKQAAIRLASERGLEELYTWTQAGNAAMQELNRSLGYVDRDVAINVRGPLPIEARW
jgi:mycothiol synthase